MVIAEKCSIVLALLKHHPEGLTTREISAAVGISGHQVLRVMESLAVESNVLIAEEELSYPKCKTEINYFILDKEAL